jgi:hypothetical protein
MENIDKKNGKNRNNFNIKYIIDALLCKKISELEKAESEILDNIDKVIKKLDKKLSA